MSTLLVCLAAACALLGPLAVWHVLSAKKRPAASHEALRLASAPEAPTASRPVKPRKAASGALRRKLRRLPAPLALEVWKAAGRPPISPKLSARIGGAA